MKVIPYNKKKKTWDHVIVEGFCFYEKGNNKNKISNACSGKVSSDCLGTSGIPRCHYFGFTEVDYNERKVMIAAWNKFNEKL